MAKTRKWDRSEKGLASYRRYHWKNRERRLKYSHEWREENKRRIFDFYSNGTMKCALCGFPDYRALCLDHIDNNGAEHRKSLSNGNRENTSSDTIYLSLIKSNFPSGFQILCHNCNIIKEYEYRLKKRLSYAKG